MNTYIIVGAGFSGLLCAKFFKDRNVPFVGLEKCENFSDEADIDRCRLYEEESVEFLSQRLEGLVWSRVPDPALERTKGEWREISGEYLPEERFFLERDFFQMNESPGEILKRLGDETKAHFKTLKSVVGLQLDQRTVTCLDGEIFEYDKVIWCAPLEALIKCLGGQTPQAVASLTHGEEPAGFLGIHLELSKITFPSRNTVIFPFKYKEWKLRALGISGAIMGGMSLHWGVYLPGDIAEDREEVAKCVRALKRELNKEFPDLKESLVKERIVYQPNLLGSVTQPVNSLNILPDIFYVGPQIRVINGSENRRNWDRTIQNCLFLESELNLTSKLT